MVKRVSKIDFDLYMECMNLIHAHENGRPGINQAEAAKRLNVCRQRVSHWYKNLFPKKKIPILVGKPSQGQRMPFDHLLHSRELGMRHARTTKRQLESFAEKLMLKSSLTQQKISAEDQLASNGTKATFLLCVSCDNTLLASCHSDHSVMIIDIYTGHVCKRLRGHPRTPWALAFHPSIPHLLASGCLAGHVRIWDLKTGCSSLIRIESDTAIACLAFHPTLPLIAIAVSNKILLRDWQSSTTVGTLKTGTKKERIRFVRFASDGKTMYTAVTNIGRSEAAARPVPSIIPASCQRMLESRRDLLAMRQDLQRRHQQLQDRYSVLLQRYRELRDAHPTINDVGPEPPAPPELDFSDEPGPSAPSNPDDPSALFQRHIEQRNRQAVTGFERATDDGAALEQLWTETGDMPGTPAAGAPDRSGRPPDRRWIRRDSPSDQPTYMMSPFLMHDRNVESVRTGPTSFSWRHRSPDLLEQREQRLHHRERPLSPIRLEHLEDAVGYAHQLTAESMRQFREFHQASMVRIRRSYAQLFQASQVLVGRFQETYESIVRMNERIEERQALATTEPGHTNARELLKALIRMQRILTTHHYPYTRQESTANVIRPLLPEIQTLLQVFDTMLAVDRDALPTNIANDLLEGRTRMQNMEEELESMLNGTYDANITEDIINHQLSTEIESFQRILLQWKRVVLERGRTEPQSDPDPDQPSTSGGNNSTRSSSGEGQNGNRLRSASGPGGLPNKRPRLDSDPSPSPMPVVRPPTPIPELDGPDGLFIAEVDDANDFEMHPGPSDTLGAAAASRTEREWQRAWSQRIPEQISRRRRQNMDEAVADRSTELFMYVPSNGGREGSRYVSIGNLPPQPMQEEIAGEVPAVRMSSSLEDEQDRNSSQQLHMAINRAIAGALIGGGDMAVANNILDLTFRIQYWQFDYENLPDLSSSDANVLVNRCKLHNDGSISISPCGTMLASFVENIDATNPVWAGTMLQVISLKAENIGHILYKETFGPNAMCLHFSPTSDHLLVGLATRNYLRLSHSAETYMQIYELDKDHPEEKKLKIVCNLEGVLPRGNRPLDLQQELESRNCSIYCATWLPQPGLGLAYGTNKGHVFLLKTKCRVDDERKEKNHRASRRSLSHERRVALARSIIQII